MPLNWLSQFDTTPIPSPVDTMLNVAHARQQMENSKIQNRVAAMQMDAEQRKMDKENALADIYKTTPVVVPARPADTTGPTQKNAAIGMLQGSSVNPDFIGRVSTIDPAAALTYQGHALDQQKKIADLSTAKLNNQKTQGEIDYKALETANKRLDVYGGEAQAIYEFSQKNPGVDLTPMVRSAKDRLSAFGIDVSKIPDTITPEQAYQAAMGSISAKEQLAQKTKDAEAKLKDSQWQATFGETTRHNKATEINQAAGANETRRHNRASEQSTNAAVSMLTPSAVDAAATRYLETGSLPPMGLGKTAAGVKATILNKSAEIAASQGMDGQAQVIQQAAYKANQQAMNQVSKQAGLAMSFERTANKNADLALALSDRVNRTGSPVINRAYLYARGQYAGDPDVSAFNTAIKTFANEYAKVTTGQTGGAAVSDSARVEIDKLINASQNPDQLRAVINTMKQEMANRRTGYEEETAKIKSGMISTKPGKLNTVGRFTVEVN